jgi:integrase
MRSKWGIMPRNAASLIDLPRAVRSEIRTPLPEQARVFLERAKKNRIGALFSVALAVGLRLGEALGLGWQDVDLAAKTVRVRQALQRLGKELTFVEPKSERSRRTISLLDFAVTLTRQRTAQKRERLKAGSRCRLVFTSTIGTPLDERNVRREFNAILTAANCPRCGFTICGTPAHRSCSRRNWNARRAFWADRAANEGALRTNLLSLAATRTRHVGSDPNVERYDPDLWTDEFARR